MGIFCELLAFLITLLVLMFAQSHNNIAVDVVFLGQVYKISFIALSLTIYAIGILSGALLILNWFFDTQKRYSNLKKQYEKTNLNADDAQNKIRVLENKVATLEAALKSALDK